MNCPVCDKAGLPNYKVSSTTCPQCNSNLEAFMLTHQLGEVATKEQEVLVESQRLSNEKVAVANIANSLLLSKNKQLKQVLLALRCLHLLALSYYLWSQETKVPPVDSLKDSLVKDYKTQVNNLKLL